MRLDFASFPYYRFMLHVVTIVFCLTASPVGAAPQAYEYEGEGGAIIRLDGSLTVGENEVSDLVVVVDGNVTMAGRAEVLVVVDGEARIRGGEVGQLIVIDGLADLTDSAVVTGDVTLIDAELNQDASSIVTGSIERDVAQWFGFGAALLGLSFAIGLGVMLILCGLLVAALMPEATRTAGAALTDRVGPMLLATLLVWLGLPMLGIASMVTIIGIPLGITIFLLVIPVLGFLGYLLTAIRVGDEIIAAVRGSAEPEHPYLATIVGIVLLFLLGAVPVLGGIVSPVASLLGAGALALIIWERFRGSDGARPAPKGPEGPST